MSFSTFPTKSANSSAKSRESSHSFLSNIWRKLRGTVLPEEKISLSDFFAGTKWYPTSAPAPIFGLIPLLLGTLLVSIGAIVLSLPFGIAVAIYLAEIANKQTREIPKPVIELLAGIPSVVYGFFGLVVIVPLIQKGLNLPVGETAFAGSVVLAIMALPTIITVAEDAMRTTPCHERSESSWEQPNGKQSIR